MANGVSFPALGTPECCSIGFQNACLLLNISEVMTDYKDRRVGNLAADDKILPFKCVGT